MKESNLSELLNRRLALLGKREHLSLLEQCLHGIERECLRVTDEGRLAQTPHPEALGAALTNELITTDYSESLLEFITPALPNPADTLSSLDKIHRFAYTKLGSEYLWSPSMPCKHCSSRERCSRLPSKARRRLRSSLKLDSFTRQSPQYGGGQDGLQG